MHMCPRGDTQHIRNGLHAGPRNQDWTPARAPATAASFHTAHRLPWNPRGAPGTQAALTSAGLSTKSWALALTQTCSQLLLQVAQLSGAHIQAAESLGQGRGFPKPHMPQRWPLRASGPGHVLQGSKCHHPATRDGPQGPSGRVRTHPLGWRAQNRGTWP